VNAATKLNRMDRLAAVLPPVLDGSVLLADYRWPGVSRDPQTAGAVRPGDYIHEQDVWLRVDNVQAVDGGTQIRCGRAPFVTLTVPAGNRVPVWPLVSVVDHAAGGGAL
jgi:hypothetical protein